MSVELEARLRRNEPRHGENASGLRNEAADQLQRYREEFARMRNTIVAFNEGIERTVLAARQALQEPKP